MERAAGEERAAVSRGDGGQGICGEIEGFS